MKATGIVRRVEKRYLWAMKVAFIYLLSSCLQIALLVSVNPRGIYRKLQKKSKIFRDGFLTAGETKRKQDDTKCLQNDIFREQKEKITGITMENNWLFWQMLAHFC